MENITWRILFQANEKRVPFMEELLGLFCYHLNLCAGLGCGCATGQGEAVCFDTVVGPHFTVRISQGPTWLLTVVELTKSIKIDFYSSGPTVPMELRALNLEFIKRNIPMQVMNSSSIE